MLAELQPAQPTDTTAKAGTKQAEYEASPAELDAIVAEALAAPDDEAGHG